jgi:hypothetical protein
MEIVIAGAGIGGLAAGYLLGRGGTCLRAVSNVP